MPFRYWMPLAVLQAITLVTPLAAGDTDLGSVLVTLHQQVEVVSQQSGVLKAVEAVEGQQVEAAMQIARTDDLESAAEYQRIQLELELARTRAARDIDLRFAVKSRDVALAELERARAAVRLKENAVSYSEMARLELLAERATLEVEQAQANLAEARLTVKARENDLATSKRRLERHRVLAPLSGVITRVDHQAGEWVEAGETIARVVHLHQLRAEGLTAAENLAGIESGSPVTLRVSLPSGRSGDFTGTLKFISPEINPVDGRVRFWALIDNPERRLQPGLPGRLSVQSRVPRITARPR